MERVARIIKQIGHPDRLRILASLTQGELTVSELTRILDLSQPRVTQYLGSMEDAGLIERLREGSWVFVRRRRDNAPLGRLVDAALAAIPPDDAALSADRLRMDDVRRARAEAAEVFFANVANSRDQLSHDFLPQASIEGAMRGAAGPGPFDHVVDLGTGTGRMLAVFAGQTRRGTGVDLSPDMLRVARHTLADHPHITVQLGDVTDTGLPAACSDLLTVHHVLHYLDNPAAALTEAARLLRPDGTVLIADFAEHEHDTFRDRYAHRRLGFAKAELSELLQDAGFGGVEVSRVATMADAPDVLVWKAQRTQTQRRAA